MKLEQFIEILWLASAVLLVIFVLLHSPKNDGIGLGGGQSQFFTSAKSAEKTLSRITWALGLVFLGSSVVLSAGWLNPPDSSALNRPAVAQPAPVSLPASNDPTAGVPDLPPSSVPTSVPSDLGPDDR